MPTRLLHVACWLHWWVPSAHSLTSVHDAVAAVARRAAAAEGARQIRAKALIEAVVRRGRRALVDLRARGGALEVAARTDARAADEVRGVGRAERHEFAPAPLQVAQLAVARARGGGGRVVRRRADGEARAVVQKGQKGRARRAVGCTRAGARRARARAALARVFGVRIEAGLARRDAGRALLVRVGRAARDAIARRARRARPAGAVAALALEV